MPILNQDGVCTHLLWTGHLITERKQSEAKLQEREYLLSESQRIAHIGSWRIDLTTWSITWTDETYSIFDVSPDTFVPSRESVLGLVHPDDRMRRKSGQRP